MTVVRNISLYIAAVVAMSAAMPAQQKFSASGAYPDVRVIESTESGLTFEFTPRYLPAKKVVSGGADYQAISFERGSASDYADAGKPDVQFRSFAVGVKGTQNNRISVVASDFETVNGFSLAPVPPLVSSPGKNSITNASKQQAKLEGFYPQEIAQLGSVALVKGVYVGYVKIFPVQYDRETRILKKYSRIVVRVDFGPPGRTTALSGDDDWMKVSLLNYAVVKRSLPAGITLAKKTLAASALSTGTWFKLEVRDDGMYKIDAAYLHALGVDLSTIGSIRDVKIYGNNGFPLPADLSQPRGADLTQQAALYVDMNGNAKFDADDYVLFYGQGVSGWTYSSSPGQFTHYTNPYTNSNFYFLQISSQGTPGKQMSTVQSPASGASVTTTVGKFFFDEERTNVTQSGLEWYSARMNSNDARVITNKLDGYVAGTPVNYKYEVLSRSDVTTTFTISESGIQIGALDVQGIDRATLDGDPVENYANRNDGQTSTIPSLADNRSTVKITYNAASTIAEGYINWFELTYTQLLSAVGDALMFTSPDTTGAVEFDLAGFSSAQFSVFDVTDLFNVKIVSSQADQAVGTYFFRDNLSGGVKRYWAGTVSAYKTPASFVRIPNTNLRGAVSGADFIIITHHDFLSEAQRLKTYKENLQNGDALKSFVVEVDTIYNEFGNGLPDPTAIRDFLYYAVSNWQPAPRYVLFFGDATFDYKNNLGLDRNWVPTYETPESDYQIATYGYDDFYAYLQPGNETTVTLAHGRLPVRSLSEARLAVDRIIQYETNPVFGSWKNLITISADDQNINGALDGADNPQQAEYLAEYYVPKSFEVKKIYEDDYPTVIASTGRTKPDARLAILNQVNQGTLVLNYTGHGNPKVWSHETILTKDDVLSQLFNGAKLTLIVAATCDWGRFDDAGVQSSAEVALVNTNGGAIGVVSADRAVYSGDNAQTNYALYKYLFPADPFGRTPRLGDGLMLAKNDANSGSLDNNRKYHLLGDPTLRLALPKLVMRIDSINGKPVSQTALDTLQALSKVTIVASLRDSSGARQSFTSDSALVSVFDADQTKTTFDAEVQQTFTFVEPGAVIYKGDNTIQSGGLRATFIIPKDISYTNKQGRISVYFTGAGTDGRGFTDSVIVGGTAATFANDVQGPAIKIYFDSRTFQQNDVVNDNPLLIVDLADSSGINSAGSSVGHRLEAWIDDDSKSIDLTEFYKSAKDNFQAGTIEYQLTGLYTGRHTLRVRAWDVYNNSSMEQTAFFVASSTALAIENVYNIPNPVRSGTTFTFQHNQLSPVDVEIKIYTVSGRLIDVISSFGYPERFVQIPWDCRDRDGSKVANGTYLYKVIAKTTDGKFTSEALGKMAIVR